jgi:hypothetical protein
MELPPTPTETPLPPSPPGEPPAPSPYDRPPIADAPLSVLLLADDATIPAAETVAAWVAHLDGLAREYEILLVTAKDAGDLTGGSPRVQTLQASSGGFGACLRRGLEAARHPLLLYTRCDGRARPADLGKLLEWIDRADLVCGYRADAARGLKEHLFRGLVRAVFGVRLHDLAAPYLLARRSLFARIPVQSDGDFAHAEVLAKANFLGALMTEAAVTDCKPGSPALPGAPGPVFREASRVFSDPDFGPAVVPAAGEGASAGR